MADSEDQLVRSSSELTRGDLLKRGTAAAFSISMFGGLTDRALGFYGPLKYAHKQLAGELRIMQWAHFVPAYDQWLDNTYVKRWGEANDVEVKVDHINNALLYSTGASQVAAQSGHDLFWFISPPSTFQKQVVPVTDIVQEVSRKLGPMSRVARKSTYNPKTKQFYGFPDDYAPDPVQYRRSYLQEAGVSLNSWESLRQGAPKLKAIGHPGRPRHVERDRLEHDADVPPLLLRRVHPERGEPDRHRPGREQEGRDRGADRHARHLSQGHVRRGLRVDGRVEQPGVPRRPAVGGAERDLDRPLGRELREHAPLGRHLARRRSRAVRTCAWATSTSWASS